MTFYNDNDRAVCAWLKELVKEGLISEGVVDDRSVREIDSKDLLEYRRVHLFAGIGGWDYALRLAGWPEHRHVWTGSCPCQPFSIAGKGKGNADERHLWPVMRRLIAECRPATIFGEQTTSPLGRRWLSRVRFDLEALGYAVGAADLCAAGVAAPHIRQRLFWVGHTVFTGLEGQRSSVRGESVDCACRESPGSPGDSGDFWSTYAVVHCADGKSRRVEPGSSPLAPRLPGRVGLLRGYGNSIVPQVAATFIKAFLETEK